MPRSWFRFFLRLVWKVSRAVGSLSLETALRGDNMDLTVYLEAGYS
jgi:hypothetical protein